MIRYANISNIIWENDVIQGLSQLSRIGLDMLTSARIVPQGYLGGMILAFLQYCYFWRDILGVLTQTFEPAPRMFSYGVPPWEL